MSKTLWIRINLDKAAGTELMYAEEICQRGLQANLKYSSINRCTIWLDFVIITDESSDAQKIILERLKMNISILKFLG